MQPPTTWQGAVGAAEGVLACVSSLLFAFIAMTWDSSPSLPNWAAKTATVTLVGVPCALATLAFAIVSSRRHANPRVVVLSIFLASTALGAYFVGFFAAANTTS
jgi:hypothetical protein